MTRIWLFLALALHFGQRSDVASHCSMHLRYLLARLQSADHSGDTSGQTSVHIAGSIFCACQLMSTHHSRWSTLDPGDLFGEQANPAGKEQEVDIEEKKWTWKWKWKKWN